MNDATSTVEMLKTMVEQFVAERAWEPFHDAKNLSASIAIEAAELMEQFQWVRSDELDDIQDDAEAMNQIRDELADITAFVLSFAATLKIDISSSLAEKMKKNAVKYPVERYRGKFK